MMDKAFEVSVVIPVYNAAPFVQKAVESALQQSVVKEVILVEDRSPDSSLEICQRLERQDHRVRLFRHPNGENRGAAASRNLGVRMATAGYVAFLDADDYYLHNRFNETGKKFAGDRRIDGVYEAIGLHIYSEYGMNRYEAYKGRKMDPGQLITIKESIQPEDLFERMLFNNVGIFHANGITARREFLIKIGLFDEDLNIVEDTVLWFKMAYHGRLVAGNISEPVARQGIHDMNREPEMQPALLFKKYERLFEYFVDKPVPKRIVRTFFMRMMSYHPLRKADFKIPVFAKAELLFLMFLVIVRRPRLFSRLV